MAIQLFPSLKLFILIHFVIVHCVYSEVYIFDDSGGLGRKFDGIGAISGGGATSKLLVNYPQKERDEIFDYLFKPSFGAALQLLKIEIGSDAQSTDGSEATHMRSPNEENYERGYEWWFMQEAKKVCNDGAVNVYAIAAALSRNPDLKLIGLPWAWPGWLGGTTGDVFANPEQTALYVVKWILAAKSKYGFLIDYIGIWNESRYTTKYIKVLRQVLDKHSLQDTLIVAADNVRDWDEISSQVLADPDLANAVYAIGVHYPGYNSSLSAMDTGKQLWASEDKSHDLYLRWILNYVDGFMSGTIMWPAVSSFYKGLPYEGAGIMNASEPWSGHYTVPPYVYLAAHTTQFTKPGWTFLQHGSGVGRFRNGGVYVSLVSPDRKDFTIIIETVHANDSLELSPENVTIQLSGSIVSIKELNCWFTRLDMDNIGDSYLFEHQVPIRVVDGRFSLDLGVNQVYTLTTLATGNKGSYPTPPSSKPFPIPYIDDFENYREYEEPYLISPQTGAYEVTSVGGSHRKVMRQMTWQMPVPWSTWCHVESAGLSFAVIGNYYWSDISIQSDVFINMTWASRAKGVFLAARVDHGGCKANINTGVFFFFYPEDKTYILSSDLERKNVLKQGPLSSVNAAWNTIVLTVMENIAVGLVNGVQVFSSPVPSTVRSGFAAVGTGSYGAADFDNLELG